MRPAAPQKGSQGRLRGRELEARGWFEQGAWIGPTPWYVVAPVGVTFEALPAEVTPPGMPRYYGAPTFDRAAQLARTLSASFDGTTFEVWRRPGRLEARYFQGGPAAVVAAP